MGIRKVGDTQIEPLDSNRRRPPVSLTAVDSQSSRPFQLTREGRRFGTVEVLQMDGVNSTTTQDIPYTADWQPVVGT